MKMYMKIILAIILMIVLKPILLPILKKDETFRNFYSRNFYKPNPTLKRNSSYDTRSGLRSGTGNAKFGGIAGVENSVHSTGIFYNNEILDNNNLFDN